jgi:hypothetical protein
MSDLAERSMASAATPTGAGWTTATPESVVERALAILDEERSRWGPRSEVAELDSGADREV